MKAAQLASDYRYSKSVLEARALNCISPFVREVYTGTKAEPTGERIIIKSSRFVPSTSSRNDDRQTDRTKPTWGVGQSTTLSMSHSLGSDIMMRKAVEARSDTSGGK